MSLFRFSKPKTPGFGLSSEFYLTVLCTAEYMPPLAALVNPKGDTGAAVGYGVPLRPGATKEELLQPLQRGPYALASKDKKTVIKMLVMSAADVSFDPLAFGRSSAAVGADPLLLERMTQVRHLGQFRFESHDPMVAPALRFILGLAVRLGSLTDGVIADPLAERYVLPERALRGERLDSDISAATHITVGFRLLATGLHAYTRGMQKFLLPELEILELLEGDETVAEQYLLNVAQGQLDGHRLSSGDRIGARAHPCFVQPGGLDSAFWAGIDVFELRPAVGVEASTAIRG